MAIETAAEVDPSKDSKQMAIETAAEVDPTWMKVSYRPPYQSCGKMGVFGIGGGSDIITAQLLVSQAKMVNKSSLLGPVSCLASSTDLKGYTAKHPTESHPVLWVRNSVVNEQHVAYGVNDSKLVQSSLSLVERMNVAKEQPSIVLRMPSETPTADHLKDVARQLAHENLDTLLLVDTGGDSMASNGGKDPKSKRDRDMLMVAQELIKLKPTTFVVLAMVAPSVDGETTAKEMDQIINTSQEFMGCSEWPQSSVKELDDIVNKQLKLDKNRTVSYILDAYAKQQPIHIQRNHLHSSSSSSSVNVSLSANRLRKVAYFNVGIGSSNQYTTAIFARSTIAAQKWLVSDDAKKFIGSDGKTSITRHEAGWKCGRNSSIVTIVCRRQEKASVRNHSFVCNRSSFIENRWTAKKR